MSGEKDSKVHVILLVVLVVLVVLTALGLWAPKRQGSENMAMAVAPAPVEEMSVVPSETEGSPAGTAELPDIPQLQAPAVISLPEKCGLPYMVGSKLDESQLKGTKYKVVKPGDAGPEKGVIAVYVDDAGTVMSVTCE